MPCANRKMNSRFIFASSHIQWKKNKWKCGKYCRDVFYERLLTICELIFPSSTICVFAIISFRRQDDVLVEITLKTLIHSFPVTRIVQYILAIKWTPNRTYKFINVELQLAPHSHVDFIGIQLRFFDEFFVMVMPFNQILKISFLVEEFFF